MRYRNAMIRHAKVLLVALLVAFGAASIAEAAPRKTVRHRPKHSTRVTSGAAGTAATTGAAPRRKATAKKKTRAGASPATAGGGVTAKKPAARAHATVARRQPTTKPR